MLKKIFLGIMFLISVHGTILAEEILEEKKVCLEESQKWLTLADQGQYDKTWLSASEYFRSLIPQQWGQAQIEGSRKSMGNLISRNLRTQDYKTSVPAAPDGDYYILVFDSSFANKKAAVEIVTMMKDKDKQWRLAGYFIK